MDERDDALRRAAITLEGTAAELRSHDYASLVHEIEKVVTRIALARMSKSELSNELVQSLWSRCWRTAERRAERTDERYLRLRNIAFLPRVTRAGCHELSPYVSFPNFDAE